MSAREKVAAIFRELAGKHAERLSGSYYLADVNSRITAALAGEGREEEILRQDGIGFHLVDWQAEAAFLVALSLYPERFTDEEIREGVDAFLIHAPSHVAEAARLAGVPITSLKDDDSQKS
jgi:hypothetical protein